MDVVFIIIFIVFIIFSCFSCFFKENLGLCCFLNIIGVYYVVLCIFFLMDLVVIFIYDFGEIVILLVKLECGLLMDLVVIFIFDFGEVVILLMKLEVGLFMFWELFLVEFLKFLMSLVVFEFKIVFLVFGDVVLFKVFLLCFIMNWIESIKVNENMIKGIFIMFYVF